MAPIIPSSPFRMTGRCRRRPVLRNGWATICLQDETTCLAWSKMVASVAKGAMVFDFTVQPKLWGWPGVPARISAVMVPPRP